MLHGDAASETFLSEIIGAAAFPMRHMSMESLYEYGSRAGLWRVLRMFEERKLPLTVFGVAMALKRNPEAVAAFRELGHEIACHGLKWISYQNIDEATERAHMAEAVQIMRELTGAAPLGWYTGRDSPNTRRLVVEHGGFAYDADNYGDDLPFWERVAVTDANGAAAVKPQLVVPYTLDTNDMRFAAMQGFNSGTQFFDYLKDAFDVLYAEGDPAGLNQPKMLSIGLHCRIVGRPGRAAALARFLDYVQQHEQGVDHAPHRHRRSLARDASIRLCKIWYNGHHPIRIVGCVRGVNLGSWEKTEASMSEPIRFYYQGKVHQLSGVAPTRTVLQHLREDLHCTGTKEGCAEGDCGACTVVIGSLENGELALKAVNSCIQFAATLDGKALFSVEDMQQPDGALHPVQQAMVECHGSQCGFCTPGFVMSLWGMYLKQDGSAAEPLPDRRRAVRQPVPLHRLQADHRRRAPHGRTAARRIRPRRAGGPAAGTAARHDGHLQRRRPALLRPAHAR